MKYIILKFGGTSVSSYDKWLGICSRVIELKSQYKVIVVVSALSGVTNKLQSIISHTSTTQNKLALLDEILAQHQALADQADIKLPNIIKIYYNDIYDIILNSESIYDSPQLQAEVLCIGELLSSTLGHAILEKQCLSVGLIDARNIIRTTYDSKRSVGENYLDAYIQPEKLYDIHPVPIYQAQNVILTQGFIGSILIGNEYKTCVLGRGGSDTSGSLFAYLSGAVKYEIYTDVDGIFTSDPNTDCNAKLIKRMNYDLAEEMALKGAKVLHYRCIEPVKLKSIPCVIRNSDLNRNAYTMICGDGFEEE